MQSHSKRPTWSSTAAVAAAHPRRRATCRDYGYKMRTTAPEDDYEFEDFGGNKRRFSSR